MILTYLLSPLHACLHIRPVRCQLCDLAQLHPRAFIFRSMDLLHVSRMATLGIDVSGILLTWPIHLRILFFTSNKMGSIPVRSWSSVLVILFGQKMCGILLRHLFWNTYIMWHITLVTFQDSAAYSSTLSTLLLKMCIFFFLLIIFVFQMFFGAANAPLTLLILVLISASVFPAFVTKDDRRKTKIQDA